MVCGECCVWLSDSPLDGMRRPGPGLSSDVAATVATLQRGSEEAYAEELLTTHDPGYPFLHEALDLSDCLRW
jgi:hypothetical protein